jgi:broad specificity phosphatase PhoE
MDVSFTRHAESLEQCGEDCVDSPLSMTGRQQSAELTGHYNLIICSPLRRCLETLHESRITYDKLEVCDLFRERRRSKGSDRLLEKPHAETWQDLEDRVKEFDRYLRERLSSPGKILLIGHGLFFRVWNRVDGPDAPENARIFRLESYS